MKNYKFKLVGLDCANCAKKIEEEISKMKGYNNVNVNFATSRIVFETNNINAEKEIKEIIKKLEPDIQVLEEKNITKEQHNNYDVIRIILGILIYIIALLGNFQEVLKNILIILAYSVLIFKTTKKAIKQIIKNKLVDENLLIVISAIGAYLVGKISEGLMVITLYEIGKILESKAVNNTRKSITQLMNIKPEFANLKIGEEFKKVNPEEIKIEDIIIVKSGEKVPLDGKIIKGNAQIDNSALTGESKVINVKENDSILSGSININGLIEIIVEKTYENSTVSKILNLVENATDKKAKAETFVSRVAKVYTPIVMILALLVAIFMPIFVNGISYKQSIYKALIFLVISCPCSIAISVPLSYFSGIGKASKKGILIKGSDYLDAIKDIKQVIFDKTGTITTGKFIVSKINIVNKKYSEKEILEYFAMGESFSNHPIAKSIMNKYEEENKRINLKELTEFKEISGKGLQYTIKDEKVKIGNADFTSAKNENISDTILYLNINGDIIGNIILTDEIKDNTKETIIKLNKLGIKTKMFTGDKKEISNKIAKKIGIETVYSEMLPKDKYEKLEEILKNNQIKNKIAFVGDGINDSPVLARADIGISMGGIGSNAAIEASDIVIMTDELNKIIEAIEISKKTNKIVKENLIFALGIKILILVLSLLGISDMWQAVFADVGTTLITIFNTLRILK